jgi:hypothetical protein
MPFGMKNGPPTYQRVISKALRDNLNQFIKNFLDNFTMYHYMDIYLAKIMFSEV